MIYALIVIYNRRCEDSKTLCSLKSQKNDIQIIIFDNSTSDYGNASFCKAHEHTYFGFGKNLGLSYAYNYVIDHVETQDDDFFIILDDDTVLSNGYLEEVKERIRYSKDLKILLPIVKAGDFILSPSNLKYGCGAKIVNSVSQLDRKHLTAINSGMVVRADLVKKIRYNENLFLDCIDHDFMKRICEQEIKIDLMTSEIQQSYSRNEKPKLKNALTRFSIYKKDFKVYCQECNNMPFFYLSMLKLLLSYTIKYKTFAFVKMCL